MREDDELEHTYRGQIVNERRAFHDEYQEFKNEQKWGSFGIFMGVMFFFMGAYSLIVPLYKILCERWGFATKTNHQEYKFDPERMQIHKKWRIHF